GCGSWGGLTEVLSDEGSGNIFLVGGEGDWALIDAGGAEGTDEVLANAAEAGAPAEDIHRIILTHSHSDHTLGADELKRLTGARVACSGLAARALGGDADARSKLFVGDRPPLAVEDILADGDELSVGPYAFTVLATPGHIPDALTLVGEAGGRRVAFTGDTAIGDQGGVAGVVGWLDGHWGSNPGHLAASIARIAACEVDLLLPGHGFPIDGADNVRRSLAHCAERLQQLLAIPDLQSMMPLDVSE
ncbi:MAG: MBL fold metallo-hydrolase, partial [Planctomycetota bacterium]